MKPFSYSKNETSKGYQCKHCKATGVKLWREYCTCADYVILLCAECAAKEQKADISTMDAEGIRESEYGKTCQIGNRVPAVPTEDGESFWGYTSVPEDGVKWFRKLPVKN